MKWNFKNIFYSNSFFLLFKKNLLQNIPRDHGIRASLRNGKGFLYELKVCIGIYNGFACSTGPPNILQHRMFYYMSLERFKRIISVFHNVEKNIDKLI